MQSMVPFITFQPSRGQFATQAIELYTRVFDDGQVIFQTPWPDGFDAPAGAIQLAEIEIAGNRIRLSDTPIHHPWEITPGISLWVEVGAAEQDRVVEMLADGGMELMPLSDYGFGRFAWVQDRFAVTWQIAIAQG